jgi:hypothetical protein
LPQVELAEGRAPWRYALGEAERALLAKLDQPYGAIGRARLGELVTVTRGAEVIKDAAEPSLSVIPGGAQIVRASEIIPFTAAPRAWLPANAFKAPTDGWRAAKVVLPRASARPQAAFDEGGAVPVSAVLALHLAAPDGNARETLLMLVALLNSAPMRAYLALTQTAYLLARPTIDPDALRALPIALGTPDVRQRLASLALELGRHYAAYGAAADDATHYPVAQRLEKTIAMEVNALYHLTDEEQVLVQRWLL